MSQPKDVEEVLRFWDGRRARAYDLGNAFHTEDIPMWRDLCAKYLGAEGHALEIGCGTLRITLPLAEAGMQISGIDISPDMLAIARQKLATQPEEVQDRVQLSCQDARTFALDARFEFVFSPWSAFEHLLTIDDQLAHLARVRTHLRPGGVFALDVGLPPDDLRLYDGAWRLVASTHDPATNRAYQRDGAHTVDLIGQEMLLRFRTKEFKDDALETEWISELRATFFFPRELRHLLARAGFEVTHHWGDYAGTEFEAMKGPVRQIMVAKLRG